MIRTRASAVTHARLASEARGLESNEAGVERLTQINEVYDVLSDPAKRRQDDMEVGGRRETHSSSGIIVSTGLGSTGWLRSVLAGTTGIASSFSGRRLKIAQRHDFAWDAGYLYFSVRELWPSTQSAAGITFGKITPRAPLRPVSQMPENGVIFGDGIEADFTKFNSGT